MTDYQHIGELAVKVLRDRGYTDEELAKIDKGVQEFCESQVVDNIVDAFGEDEQ